MKRQVKKEMQEQRCGGGSLEGELLNSCYDQIKGIRGRPITPAGRLFILKASGTYQKVYTGINYPKFLVKTGSNFS